MLAIQTYFGQSVRLPALLAALATLVVASPAAQADTTNGNLPGGTSITAGISSPADGALIASPPGDVAVSGSASVGEGVPVAHTTLIYVVDRSTSTTASAGCGGDQNDDGFGDTVLDCEIAAARALNQQAITAGTVDEVGAVFFSDGAAIQDSGPTTPGTQGLTGPATDADSNSAPDVEDVLGTASSGGNTSFEAAVQEACSLVQQSTNPNTIVMFLSDGVATVGGNAIDDLPCAPTQAVFQTFAVGGGSSCANTGGGRGSLDQIAGATGGSCTTVTDVATLPDVVPGIIASELTQLELTVDGGTPTDISSTASPSLPQTGPVSVSYATTVTGLAPGNHDLCVRATGSDGGGSGSVEHCHAIVVVSIELSPAEATNELGTPGQTHTVTATVAAGSDGGVAGVEVSFEIGSGPNAGETATAVTDAAGEAQC